MIAHQWQKAGQLFAGVVYAHQQNVADRQAIDDLELIAKASEADDLRNKVEYIPLR